MKTFSKILSFFLCLILLSGSVPNSLTVNAAKKNTVKTSITKIESKAKGFKVTWKKKSKIKGYQIQYSTSSKFKKSATKTKTIKNTKTKSATISKLKGCNKKYYVRVRTYKVSKGKKIYSSWSKPKKVTTLKHKYSKATSTKPKTCKYCKKTSGKPLSDTIYYADFIGKTVGDVKKKFGKNYEFFSYSGSTAINYKNNTGFFFILDNYYIRPLDECKINYAFVSGSKHLTDKLTGAMTYKEIVSALGASVIKEKPTYWFNNETGTYNYTLDFKYDGYTINYTWENNPETNKSTQAMAMKQSTPNSKNIAYSLNHLIEAIYVLNNYENWGAGCYINYRYPAEAGAWNKLNKDQAQWADDLCCSACCDSVSEAKDHVNDYLAPNMCKNFNKNTFVEYKGRLFIVTGAKGYIEYETNISGFNVVRTAYNKLAVVTKLYNSGGTYLNDVRVDFEYLDGSYKIVKVSDLD